VKLTPGFNLAGTWIIDTVGPVWQGGAQGEAELLCSCYMNSPELASAKVLEKLPFLRLVLVSIGLFLIS